MMSACFLNFRYSSSENTPDIPQSKPLILSKNADQKSFETEFLKSKTPFLAILIRVRRLLIAFRAPPCRCGHASLSQG